MRIVLMLLIGFFSVCNLCAEGVISDSDVLQVSNEFIKISVNNTDFDAGRFSVDTVEGDPESDSDNQQPLIYGRPIPWTSYTTVLVDGVPYIFGGPSKKLLKRGISELKFSTLVSQDITPDGIRTVSRVGDVFVTQTLSLFRSPFTGVNDTAFISYSIENKGVDPHRVGLRVMLDTMLGSNDGAPFRIGSDAVQSEKMLPKAELEDFWQTFDDLDSPTIIAQGTLKLTGMAVFPPDKLVLANWGSLVDHPWDFQVEEGRSFIREGEFEQDTALAMYWNDIDLNAGETREVHTLYGLGGISLEAGELSLGITAPAEIYGIKGTDFLMVAYVRNSGDFDSLNTQVQFQLPPGFTAEERLKRVAIGTLKSGETKQVPIRVTLNSPGIGENLLKVTVSSDTLKPNEIVRSINLVAPPNLQSNVFIRRDDSDSFVPYYTINQSVKNPSKLAITNVESVLSLPEGMILAPFDVNRKHLHQILPFRQGSMNWKVIITDEDLKEFPVTIATHSDAFGVSKKVYPLEYSMPRPALKLSASDANVAVGDYVYLSIDGYHLESFSDRDIQVRYEGELVEFIRWSPSFWQLESLPDVTHDDSQVSLSRLSNDDPSSKLGFGKIHFKAIDAGDALFSVYQDGNRVAELSVTIGEEQE